MRFSILLILLAAPLLLAEEKKKKPPTPGEIVIPEPGTPIEDAAVAKQEVARFKERVKTSDEPRAEVERLGKWDHPHILKAAARYLRARDAEVAIAAAVACARQESSKAKAGSALFRQLGSEKRPEVICALLVALGKTGYDKVSAQKKASKFFRKEEIELRKAAARYFGYVQSKEMFRTLAEKLAEPSYDSADPNRPLSAEERQRRWKLWNDCLPAIRWALAQIVPGETFETMEEARGWVEAEGKAHGIRW